MLPKRDPLNRGKQKPRAKRNPYIRVLTLAFFSFFSIFLLSQSARSISLTNEKLGIFELAKKEVDELRLVNITLLQEKKEVITDDYIETVARNRLNYSKENEIAFIIPEDVINDPVLDDYLDQFRGYEVVTEEESSEPPSFFEAWIDFLVTGV